MWGRLGWTNRAQGAIIGRRGAVRRVARRPHSGHVIEPVERRLLLASSVGNLVWWDINGNGLQDAGEPGVAGIVVELFSSTDGTVGNADDVSRGLTITDSNGNYVFNGLSAGVSYYLDFRIPSDTAFTTQGVGSDHTRDSKANATGLTGMFTLISGQDRTDLDTGLTGGPPNFGFAFRAGGPTGVDAGKALATDAAGNVFVTGSFAAVTGTDFDPGPGVWNLSSTTTDTFIAKYTANGSFVWARAMTPGLMAGSACEPTGIALTPDGGVVVTGFFGGTVDFDPGIGSFTLTGNGDTDIFVCKLDSAGNFLWAKAIGASGEDKANGIAVAADGGILTTGHFHGTVDFDPGAGVSSLSASGGRGNADIFVWKLDQSGNFVWAKALGGAGEDDGRGIALATDGSVYTTGFFAETADFDPGPGASDLVGAGSFDIFISKLNAVGDFVWAKRIGDQYDEQGNAIAVGPDGSVVSTGRFNRTIDFDPGSGVFNLTSTGNYDVYVSKLDSAGNFVWARSMGGSDSDVGSGIAVGTDGAIYTAGSFISSGDFDPGAGISMLIARGYSDGFVSKLDSSGNFVWAKSMGGTAGDDAYGVVPASDGAAFITGSFGGIANFDPNGGPYNLTSNAMAGADIFICKYASEQAPTDIALSASSVADLQAAGALVGTLVAVDPNLGDSFTYSLVSGAGSDDNLSFVIVGDQLQTTIPVNRDTKSSYTIRVRATDHTARSFEKSFTITVGGVVSPIGLSINDISIVEGNSGTTSADFTVTLSQPATQTVTVQYATAAGTAVAGVDYNAASGILTFAPGQTSRTVSVQVIGDILAEPNRSFHVNLSSSFNASITHGSGLATIIDDDAASTITINDVSVREGDLGTINASFTVTLSTVSGQTTTVHYATADGTAKAAVAYLATSGNLTFAPGETSKTVNVPVIGDTLNEDNQTFAVNLSGAANATIGRASGIGTITDDDPVPIVSINGVSVAKSNSGTSNATFTLSLSGASGKPITVQYATADGTASAGSDYVAVSGTVTFTAGQTSKTIDVAVKGDTVVEPDETFLVKLSNAANATLGAAQATGTIRNNTISGPIAIFIGDVTVMEGASAPATIAVTLSHAGAVPITVAYATADDTARSGSDYTATNGTLTFAPGETTKNINVQPWIIDNAIYEQPESFLINLSSPTNATLGDIRGTVNVLDNEPAPSLSINDVSMPEGNSGLTSAVFTVTLSGPSQTPVTVQYATANGTAVSNIDFAPNSGTLTFPAGQTSKTITVSIFGDTTVEPDKTYIVNLSNPTIATIGHGLGLGAIVNDDFLPVLSIADSSIVEGVSGVSTMNFIVTLAPVSAQAVTVHYATAPGSAGGSDFTAASGTLVFAPGQTSKTIPIQVVGDKVVEPDKTFTITLSNATNADIGRTAATGTIIDEYQPPPAISIGDIAVGEGAVAAANVVITLSAASTETVTVAYATADGSAKGGSDYTAANGTLSFAPGETSKSINVQPWIIDDLIHQGTQTFVINLSSPGNATIDHGQGTVSIQDNDPEPTIRINDMSVNEGASGNTPMDFTVTLSNPSTQTVTVQFNTADGTAIAGADYLVNSGTVNFAPGQVSNSLRIMLKGDTISEASRSFMVNLSTAANATIADSQGVGTILNYVAPAAPQIKVALVAPATIIQSRQTAAISFGSVRINATGPSKVFRVTNTGATALTLGAIRLPAGYQLVGASPPTLAPNKAATFTVKLVTTKAGKFSGQISFATNVAGLSTFTFPVTGTVTAAKNTVG